MEYNVKIIEYDDYIHIQKFLRTQTRVDFPKDVQVQFDDYEKEVIIDDLTTFNKIDDQEKQKHCIETSLNRSKNNLFRIARSNKWDYFITLTFDQKKYDSSDYNFISKTVTVYLNNLRRKNTGMKYLIVPELHKDKKHYHLHGLLADLDDFDLDESGHFDRFGQMMYNIPSWKYGFSTCMRIYDQSAVRNYIGKYITKELMQKLKYKKRYYASKNVNIAEERYSFMTDQDIYDLYADKISFVKTIDIQGINQIKYFEIKKDIDTKNSSNYNDFVKGGFSE